MSDLNALAQKLNALATNDDVFDHGARVISQGGVPAPLNALLDAIDETVLERRLDFAAGDAVVSLIAAGRRLRGLVAVSPANDTASALIGVPLSREEPDLLDAAFAVLTGTFGAATQLTVRSLPSEPFGTSGERGVAATGWLRSGRSLCMKRRCHQWRSFCRPIKRPCQQSCMSARAMS